MAVYGVLPPDYFQVDDFLDFSDDQLFSASATGTTTATTAGDDHHRHQFPAAAFDGADCERNALNPHHSAFFTADLCVPSDDIAQLEWLSNFVEDSFTESPENSFAGTLTLRPETSFHSRSRSKRFRSTSSKNRRICSPESDSPAAGKSNPNAISTITKRREGSSSSSGITGDHSTSCETLVRQCSHCASEKTPQWRAGPLGPKTLCNACGLRYKSGRLVPEYQPAASPTFVLTQHSNSHRKVMELRRQKDILLQQQQQEEELQIFHRRHNSEVY